MLSKQLFDRWPSIIILLLKVLSFHTYSESINVVIFLPLNLGSGFSVPKKLDPNELKKVLGHLKIVVQTTSTSKEHAQLRFGVQKNHRPYFENSGPNWSKLGSLIGYLISIHMANFILEKLKTRGDEGGEGVPFELLFALCHVLSLIDKPELK